MFLVHCSKLLRHDSGCTPHSFFLSRWIFYSPSSCVLQVSCVLRLISSVLFQSPHLLSPTSCLWPGNNSQTNFWTDILILQMKPDEIGPEEWGGLLDELLTRIHQCILFRGLSGVSSYLIDVTLKWWPWSKDISFGLILCHLNCLSSCLSSSALLTSLVGGTKIQEKEFKVGIKYV